MKTTKYESEYPPKGFEWEFDHDGIEGCPSCSEVGEFTSGESDPIQAEYTCIEENCRVMFYFDEWPLARRLSE